MPTQSWTAEFKEAFKSLPELYQFLEFPMPAELKEVADRWPIFIPKTLAAKIKHLGEGSVLAQEFLPHVDEIRYKDFGLRDPIGDQAFNKAPQLIHRYSSRALFTPTTICPVHCRYCFRKNELTESLELFKPRFEETLSYLKDHSEISEIIFTGGDPFTLSDERLQFFLDAFSKISHVKDIRFHTRYPVIMPSRIDDGLLDLLRETQKNFRTVSIAIHSNHIDEMDETSDVAIKKLSHTGVQLLSQTVLLKSVNDSESALLELMEKFIDLKVRPYYLHHPDQVAGGMHFYLTLEEGRRIFQGLRKNLPGWAIPQYIIDLPGGEGKTPAYNPEDLSFSGQLMNLQGNLVAVAEPVLQSSLVQ